MKKHIKVILGMGLGAAFGATTAFTQPLISVDEWGVGTIAGSPLTWQTSLVEPFSGMTTLSYNLPFLGNRGDVVIADSDGTVSDIIRFDGNSHLFFFSDLPGSSLADVGIPGFVAAAPVLFFNEVIVGGAEGYFGYLPVGNDPGGTTAPVMYDFISDYMVPEPSLPALLACGFGLLTVGQRWKQSSRRSVN